MIIVANNYINTNLLTACFYPIIQKRSAQQSFVAWFIFTKIKYDEQSIYIGTEENKSSICTYVFG